MYSHYITIYKFTLYNKMQVSVSSYEKPFSKLKLIKYLQLTISQDRVSNLTINLIKKRHWFLFRI